MRRSYLKNLFDNDFCVLIFFSLISIIPLLIVYILEYFFSVAPCKLCVYERIPLFVIAVLPILFFFSKKNSIKGFFIVFFAILFNVALSFYHVGIENKWFVNNTCKGLNSSHGTLESLFLSSNTLFQQCDIVKFRFLKLSLAEWNFIYCLLFFILINFFLVKRFLNKNL